MLSLPHSGTFLDPRRIELMVRAGLELVETRTAVTRIAVNGCGSRSVVHRFARSLFHAVKDLYIVDAARLYVDACYRFLLRII